MIKIIITKNYIPWILDLHTFGIPHFLSFFTREGRFIPEIPRGSALEGVIFNNQHT